MNSGFDVGFDIYTFRLNLAVIFEVGGAEGMADATRPPSRRRPPQ